MTVNQKLSKFSVADMPTLKTPKTVFFNSKSVASVQKQNQRNCCNMCNLYPTLRTDTHIKIASVSNVLFLSRAYLLVNLQQIACFSPNIKYRVTLHPFSKYEKVELHLLAATLCPDLIQVHHTIWLTFCL